MVLEHLKIAPDRRYEIELALGEAATNVVRHAYPHPGHQYRVELKISDSATIVTPDGSQAGLEQLKEGDQVRASLDPSSNQATKLEVVSKDKDKSGKSDKSDSKSDTGSKSDSKKY